MHGWTQEPLRAALAAVPRGGCCAAPGTARRGTGGGSTKRGLRGREQLGGSSGRGRASTRRELWGPGSSSEGFGWRLRGEGALRPRDCQSNSAGLGPREPETQPRIQRSPGTDRGQEAPGQQGHSCPELSRSVPCPGAPRPLQTESSIVTAGADSRTPSWPPSLWLFLLGPHRVNNPSSSPKC